MKIKICSVLLLLVATIAHSATIKKYRVFCNTENTFAYAWSEVPPSRCPNNTNDTINPASITVVDELGSAFVEIKEETTPTGRNFKTETRKITAAPGPGVVTTEAFSWPFVITIMDLYFVSAAIHEGDKFYIDLPFDRVIGAITAPVTAGDTVIHVNQTVIDNIMVGYNFYLDDGINLEDCGRVLAIDTETNTITVETAVQNNFSELTPTYAKITGRHVEFDIGSPHKYPIAFKKIGGTTVPANESARLTYINNSSEEKIFIIVYEYLF